MDICKQCRFWLNWDSENTNLGECHRFPPRMAMRDENGPEGMATITVRPEDGGWPLTYPDDWCGEFQPSQTRPVESMPASEPRRGDADAVI
jgi:hypothetical protein